jgi:hypothetical protein
MKDQTGSRGIALLYSLFDMGARLGGWVVNATLRPLYPWNDPVPLVQAAGWGSGPVWTVCADRHILLPSTDYFSLFIFVPFSLQFFFPSILHRASVAYSRMSWVQTSTGSLPIVAKVSVVLKVRKMRQRRPRPLPYIHILQFTFHPLSSQLPTYSPPPHQLTASMHQL